MAHDAQARELGIEGYIVLPLSDADGISARAAFNKFVFDDKLPELTDSFNAIRKSVLNPLNTAGSFGACNMASAYHHPSSIAIDKIALKTARGTLHAYAKLHGLKYLSVVPDRMCFRTSTPGSESPHTDNTAGVEEESDVFFGGFLNLNPLGPDPNSAVQIMSLIPRSHKMKASFKGGDFSPAKGNKAYLKRLKAQMRGIEVKPNHMILFFENCMHEVLAKRILIPVRRKFTAFMLRVSHNEWCTCFDAYDGEKRKDERAKDDGHVLCPHRASEMTDQAALDHKGGVKGPMYPKLYWTNHVTKLATLTKQLQPKMLTERTFASGKRQGEVWLTPRQFPPSLHDLQSKYTYAADVSKRFHPVAIMEESDVDEEEESPQKRANGKRKRVACVPSSSEDEE